MIGNLCKRENIFRSRKPVLWQKLSFVSGVDFFCWSKKVRDKDHFTFNIQASFSIANCIGVFFKVWTLDYSFLEEKERKIRSAFTGTQVRHSAQYDFCWWWKSVGWRVGWRVGYRGNQFVIHREIVWQYNDEWWSNERKKRNQKNSTNSMIASSIEWPPLDWRVVGLMACAALGRFLGFEGDVTINIMIANNHHLIAFLYSYDHTMISRESFGERQKGEEHRILWRDSRSTHSLRPENGELARLARPPLAW